MYVVRKITLAVTSPINLYFSGVLHLISSAGLSMRSTVDEVGIDVTCKAKKYFLKVSGERISAWDPRVIEELLESGCLGRRSDKRNIPVPRLDKGRNKTSEDNGPVQDGRSGSIQS